MRKLLDWLINPFSKEIPYLISLWMLVSLPQALFWTLYGNLIFCCYLALHGLLITYIVVFFLTFLHGNAARIYRCLFYLLGVTNAAIDVIVHSCLKSDLTTDVVAICMGSNSNEALEFLKMYFDAKVVGLIFFVIMSSIMAYYIAKKVKGVKLVQLVLGILILAGSSIIFIRQSNNWNTVFLMKVKNVLSYKPVPSLLDYKRHYRLKKEDKLPKEFVLIIGESLNKSHMSLYGYNKQTNPCLGALPLIIFTQTKSGALGTIPAFKQLMTSLKKEEDESFWLQKDFLIDVVQSAGYNVRWISNQSSSGIYDNIVARFTELADSVIWCGTKYQGIRKSDFDEVVLPPIKQRVREFDSDSLRFTIVHLMGNHEIFSSRYPQEFTRFKENDYEEYPRHQRKIRSEYDNSVYYNDWVVSEIIKTYQDKEVIVFYISDHALDIFDSSDDYVGHARSSIAQSVKAGENIPFLIYVSPKFEKKFAQKTKKIKESRLRAFSTDNLMYAIMDVIGISFAGNDSVHRYSPFR